MREDFLHYVWQHRHYDFLNLKTTSDRTVNVAFPGYHNHDAGPDFLQAVVVIDDMRWVGSVEIHCRSSDWLRHNHQHDDKYKSVILHVVYEHDMEISIGDGEYVPTLELKGRIPSEMFTRYEKLINEPDMLLCRHSLSMLEPVIIQNQLSSSLAERMQHRQNGFQLVLKSCQQDWNELIYRAMAIGFGCKKNGTAFELLSQNLPYRIIRSHLSSRLQIYALVFGQSGMLDVCKADDYVEKLRYEYDYLRYKYRLSPIGAHHWNWLRLRPQNFPSLRLAQFAQMLFETGGVLSDTVLKAGVRTLQSRLSVTPDEYWETHYQFGKISPHHVAGMGVSIVNSLIINVVVPVRFTFSIFSGDVDLQENALSLLENVDYEDNVTTRIFTDSLFPKRSAYDSQAQLELFATHCSKKRCLDCCIGEKIVRKEGVCPCGVIRRDSRS